MGCLPRARQSLKVSSVVMSCSDWKGFFTMDPPTSNASEVVGIRFGFMIPQRGALSGSKGHHDAIHYELKPKTCTTNEMKNATKQTSYKIMNVELNLPQPP